MGCCVEDLAKTSRECIRQAGLRKKSREPVALGAFADRLLNMAADRDNRNVARVRVLLQILKKLPGVVVRHREIGHDDVRVHLPRAAKRLRSLLRRDNVESHRRQRKRIQRASVFVAFDNDWRFTFINAAAERMWGVDASVWIGRTLGETVGRDGSNSFLHSKRAAGAQLFARVRAALRVVCIIASIFHTPFQCT